MSLAMTPIGFGGQTPELSAKASQAPNPFALGAFGTDNPPDVLEKTPDNTPPQEGGNDAATLLSKAIVGILKPLLTPILTPVARYEVGRNLLAHVADWLETTFNLPEQNPFRNFFDGLSNGTLPSSPPQETES